MSKVVTYNAFGLTIKSEIILPELLNSMDINIDIEIKYADLLSQYEEKPKDENGFIITENQIFFKFPGIAIFCVQEGKRIFVSPTSCDKDGQIRLLVLGTCMGLILMQRKILPLHGSAVVINNKAYAIVGEQGAGKSTLASAFIKNGFKLISDDVIAVSFLNDIPFLIPSYPQQKLWDSSLVQFGMNPKNFSPLYDRETKYSIPIESNFVTGTFPLAGVFELIKTNEENIRLKKVTEMNCLKLLCEHTYRNFLIPQLGLLEWHFEQSLQIINAVDMYSLYRPESNFTAFELVDLILETIEGINKNVNIHAFAK